MRSWQTATLSIVTTLGILFSLMGETLFFFREVSILEFLTETEWTPLFSIKKFGIWPLVTATALVAFIALAVAIPTGLLIAIYLSEFARPRVRDVVKPVLEVLAGVPTVVYGYFALTLVTPILQEFIPGLRIFNALSAGIVMGVMIIPMVASLSEDAIGAVPQALREGAYGLGATRFEVAYPSRGPGGALRHRGLGGVGALTRGWRNHDCLYRGGPKPHIHAGPPRADRDDDRVHCAGKPWRHAVCLA